MGFIVINILKIRYESVRSEFTSLILKYRLSWKEVLESGGGKCNPLN